MAAQKGSAMLLKVDISGTATTVAGLRSTSISMNDEAVDVTTKDSSGLRQLLAGGGVQSFSASGSYRCCLRGGGSHRFRRSKNSGNVR